MRMRGVVMPTFYGSIHRFAQSRKTVNRTEHGVCATLDFRSNPVMTATDCATIPWLVFSDDWGRHPTSCQHLIRYALPSQPVTWVNLIGTRRPKLDRATIRRGFEKVGQWVRPTPSDVLPYNLNVLSPKVWPGFS